MDLIADILLVAGALGVAFYCFVLSKRLSKFNDLENGVGGAVAVLSAQVDDLSKAMVKAQGTARAETAKLEELTERAESAAKQLELLMASMHDLPGQEKPAAKAPSETPSPSAGASQAAPAEAAPADEPTPIFSRAARGSV